MASGCPWAEKIGRERRFLRGSIGRLVAPGQSANLYYKMNDPKTACYDCSFLAVTGVRRAPALKQITHERYCD
jgi:hypothetical protein